MTLRLTESWDVCTAAQYADGTTGWTFTGEAGRYQITATGRTGSAIGTTASGGPNNELLRTIDSQAEWYVGFAFKMDVAPSGSGYWLWSFYDAGQLQCDVRINTAGKITLTRNGTVLATSGLTFPLNTWRYVEVYAKIHSTTGAMTVRVDGAVAVSVTGANTQVSANATADKLGFGTTGGQGITSNPYWDDVYIADGTAAQTFLGDCKVAVLRPSAAGATTGWTPSAGANYAAVDEPTANDDTDYVSAATVALVDTYAFGNLSGTIPTIHAVNVKMRLRKDDAGASSVAAVARPGATDNVGDDKSPSTTYVLYDTLYLVNPDTAVAWTKANVDASEFGVKRTA